jgi:phage-related protein/predicted XRE-type DNA-binding protein
VKPIAFLGGSLDDLRSFPSDARREAGYQLDRVQRGFDPDDWRSMPSIGAGVREIRVRERAGAFRVIYVATFADAVYVLHAFQKKTRQTAKRDVDLAASRLREQMAEDAMTIEVFESVWDALEDTPTETENMKLRSSLMIAISEAVSAWQVTQADAAKRLGVTQPRLNDLLRGRVGKFSLDALVALAARAGLAVHLEITLAA